MPKRRVPYSLFRANSLEGDTGGRGRGIIKTLGGMGWASEVFGGEKGGKKYLYAAEVETLKPVMLSTVVQTTNYMKRSASAAKRNIPNSEKETLSRFSVKVPMILRCLDSKLNIIYFIVN